MTSTGHGAAGAGLRSGDAPQPVTRTGGAAGKLTVVGIGEDGWAGLGQPARDALATAPVILGSARQLALLPDDVGGTREAWPSPMGPRVEALADAIRSGEAAGRWAVLGSGDPMLHGIGATLARAVGPSMLHVIPAPSAFSIACARLGWAQHDTPLVSRVAQPATPVAAELRRAGRAVVYVPGASGARDLAAELRDEGLTDAHFTVMERLGGDAERIRTSTVAGWDREADPLHLVAIELSAPVPASARGRLDSTVPGLPDELYGGDGQLTRAELRAVALASLAPRAGERLWDVGAGSGTIAIEWCRAASGATAVAIERREDRARTIAENAALLGAAGVEVVVGAAPLALEGLPEPDAIFVGGGPAAPGLIDGCWQALRSGGRLVAAAVTLEGEAALAAAHATYGGRLVRIETSHAEPLGSFTGWKPQRPVVQWSATKEPQA
jgi:precorrin-6Y C5,15-methyltransferase (decarboxylating)